MLINYNILGLPMGGWKNSGIGVRHGAQGIRRFCHTEALTIPRLPSAKSEPVWFPYSARKRGVVRRLYTFINARGLQEPARFQAPLNDRPRDTARSTGSRAGSACAGSRRTACG